jgi:hypothetical protein
VLGLGGAWRGGCVSSCMVGWEGLTLQLLSFGSAHMRMGIAKPILFIQVQSPHCTGYVSELYATAGGVSKHSET